MTEICGSKCKFKLGKGIFAAKVTFSCHREEGHTGMCRYSFQWTKGYEGD